MTSMYEPGSTPLDALIEMQGNQIALQEQNEILLRRILKLEEFYVKIAEQNLAMSRLVNAQARKLVEQDARITLLSATKSPDTNK